jgi:hypothetical protein
VQNASFDSVTGEGWSGPAAPIFLLIRTDALIPTLPQTMRKDGIDQFVPSQIPESEAGATVQKDKPENYVAKS